MFFVMPNNQDTRYLPAGSPLGEAKGRQASNNNQKITNPSTELRMVRPSIHSGRMLSAAECIRRMVSKVEP
jgi:hypothetical protein